MPWTTSYILAPVLLLAAVLAVAVPSGAESSGARVAKAKTLVLRSHSRDFVAPSDFTAVGTDVLKLDGESVGYQAYRGVFDPKTDKTKIDVVIFLEEGTIRVNSHPDKTGEMLVGNVTGGTGAYQGAKGRLTNRDISRKVAEVTVELR